MKFKKILQSIALLLSLMLVGEVYADFQNILDADDIHQAQEDHDSVLLSRRKRRSGGRSRERSRSRSRKRSRRRSKGRSQRSRRRRRSRRSRRSNRSRRSSGGRSTRSRSSDRTRRPRRSQRSRQQRRSTPARRRPSRTSRRRAVRRQRRLDRQQKRDRRARRKADRSERRKKRRSARRAAKGRKVRTGPRKGRKHRRHRRRRRKIGNREYRKFRRDLRYFAGISYGAYGFGVGIGLGPWAYAYLHPAHRIWGPRRFYDAFGCYYYPNYGFWYYPGFHAWYYPWSRCWYYPYYGYWYYPWLNVSLYVPERRTEVVYVEKSGRDDVYVAVYFRVKASDGTHYLYRVDEPQRVDQRVVKVALPDGDTKDYVVLVNKDRKYFEERDYIIQDPKDGPQRELSEDEEKRLVEQHRPRDMRGRRFDVYDDLSEDELREFEYTKKEVPKDKGKLEGLQDDIKRAKVK